MLDESEEMGYQIADAHRSESPRVVRTMAFPEGVGSHTKVAAPDPGESQELKIAGMEMPPGEKCDALEHNPNMKVATPDGRASKKIATPDGMAAKKVATPPGISVNGDFCRPIKVSGESAEARQKIGLKLAGTAMNPAYALRQRKR